MDLFAIILVTITAITICGICLFIFVCAFQPKFLRKLHGNSSRTYQETDSNVSSNENNEDHHSIKSLDVPIESNEPTTTLENSSTLLAQTNNRDKKAYLKSLEQSLRTGRPIQDDEDNDNNIENRSHSNPLNFISRFINKYIRRRTTDTDEIAEL